MASDRTNAWSDLASRMSPGAKDRVDARVRETLASLPIGELRAAIAMTRAELGGAATLESQTDMYIAALRRSIESLGGTLHLTAEFPDGRRMELDQLSGLAAE